MASISQETLISLVILNSADTKTLVIRLREGHRFYLLQAKELWDWVLIADALKSEAATAIKKLHDMGISIVMLTGDNKTNVRNSQRSRY